MAWLDQFSEGDRRLLVSLPYKTGLWVSDSDASGGVHAEYDELYKLEEIIENASVGSDKSFIREIAQESLARQQEWSAWAGECATLLDDCRAAMRVLNGKVSRTEADLYRRHLVYVGTAIARAFYERYSDTPQPVRIWKRLHYTAAKLLGAGVGEYNISRKEREALARLAEALQS
jgi:hypothetical protein